MVSSEENSNHEFTIGFIDHVAIRVQDLVRSSEWYHKVLGLKKYQLPEWGAYPIFMLSGKSGIALFPAKMDDPEHNPGSTNVKIDHFAFNVTNENFEKAQEHFDALQVDFHIQDHHYFESIYIRDPDGHTVELTTIRVKEEEFYR